MGPASPQPTLHRLRQTLAAIDPSLKPGLIEPERSVALGLPALDEPLRGGLARDALHDIVPAGPFHLAAASGFAMTVMARAAGEIRGEMLWITTGLTLGEGGGPYGPGLDLFGIASARLLVLRVRRAVDALWAMEEGLRCRALASVIAELGDDRAADLTATRRLMLAAREGGCPGLLLRQRVDSGPVAAVTRWRVAAAPSRPDRFGGLGRTAFDLVLCKNRRGPCGRWIVEWNHHERAFETAVSVGLAAAAFDRPDRAAAVAAG